MSEEGSITLWLTRLKQGDRDEASRQLWQSYFSRLVRLAQSRLANRPQLASSAEDVALSAFNSFVKAIECNRFPRLDDRDDLWQVLLLITSRKAGKLLRRELGPRHGGGRVQALSEVQPEDSTQSAPLPSGEPDPVEAAAMAEACERLLEILGDERLRQVAQWKLEGFTNLEIAGKLGCSVGTVERKLQLIRSIWERAP